MQKSTKIIAIVLVSTVALCCVIAGIGSVMNTQEETTTLISTTSATSAGISENTTVSAPVSTTQATTVASQLEELILGKWIDSANMSGFEFFSNGTVAFTYVNLESFNIPFEGKAENGVYVIDGDMLTIKYSIYSATISRTYQTSVNGNVLTMKDIEENETFTYQRDTSSGSTTTTASTTAVTTTNSTTAYQSTVDDIIGSWVSVDGSVSYKFNYDGTLNVNLFSAVVPSLASSAVTGSYNGIYLIENSKVTIQYTVNSEKVTNSYTYTTNINSLTLTDSTGNSVSFVREGTGYTPISEDELLGKWRDGVNMSGYEFKQDGIVKITFVDITIPILDLPVNGTFTGTYEISGNEITISYSIYGNAISETYTYTIENNVLSLTNKSNNNVSTYMKQ